MKTTLINLLQLGWEKITYAICFGWVASFFIPIKGFLIIKIPFCTPRRQSAADAGGLAAGLAVGELAVRTTLSSRSVARDTSGRTCHEVERGGGRSGK